MTSKNDMKGLDRITSGSIDNFEEVHYSLLKKDNYLAFWFDTIGEFMNLIKIKRIYDPTEENDGYRVLVDRLWPRGISKEKAKLDEWAKQVAPSTEIRKEFHHDPTLMDNFKLKYTHELNCHESSEEFADRIKQKLIDVNVTLLYAAKSQTVNHATILKSWLEERI